MVWELVLRLFLAGVLGALIGLDREYRAKEAGYRTHFLVSLGSALMMMVSQYGFLALHAEEGISFDSARVAAQVVTGIGFIGAGTIILQKQIVRGLTTAACIWVTAGIGLAIGAGLYVLGVMTTLLALVGLEVLSRIFKSIGMRSFMVEFSTDNKATLDAIRNRMDAKEYMIVSYQMEMHNHQGITTYQVSMVIKARKDGGESVLSLLREHQEEIIIYRIE